MFSMVTKTEFVSECGSLLYCEKSEWKIKPSGVYHPLGQTLRYPFCLGRIPFDTALTSSQSLITEWRSKIKDYYKDLN